MDQGSTYLSRSRLVVNERKLEKIRIVLSKHNNTGEHENEMKFITEEDLTIGSAPSVDSFNRWVETHRGFKCDLINGRIIVREVQTAAHAAAQGKIITELFSQGLIVRPATNMISRVNRDIMQPDVLIVVRGISTRPGGTRPGSSSFIPIVFEVACTQSPLNMHLRASHFLGAKYPATEFYVGLQRYEPRIDGSQAMVAAVYTRGNAGLVPIQVVSFGTAPLFHTSWWAQQNGMNGFPAYVGVGYGGGACNAPGIPMYTLEFPSIMVYNTHQGGVPVGAPAAYTLDLHVLQVDLEENIEY